MTISCFEVLIDLRDNDLGTTTMKELLQIPKIKVYQLYPRNENSKRFWERLGFVKEYDGVGEFIWIYRR